MNIEVVKKAIKGDEKSFVALIETRQEKIYKIAYSYVKNQEDSLDIVQETVCKAFVSIGTLKNPQYFDTWLIRIGINCALAHLKKNKQYVQLEEDHKKIKDDTTLIEESFDLNKALDLLEPQYKTIILLKYFEDLTFADIAKVLDYPISTVKTYLYRALKHLKISMEAGDSYEQ